MWLIVVIVALFIARPPPGPRASAGLAAAIVAVISRRATLGARLDSRIARIAPSTYTA